MTSLLIICFLATAAGQAPDEEPPASVARPSVSPAASEIPVGEGPGEEPTRHAGTRRALVLCGHPGTEVFRETYRQSAEKIHDALLQRWGFRAEDVWVRYGVDPNPEAAVKRVGFRGPATRQAIFTDVAQLEQSLAPNDTLWVVVIGHSHFDGRNVFLNLPDQDMSQSDFGKLFENVKCREQVFFITVPASGFFTPNLSTQGRVVITASEADVETNEAIFYQHLAKVLADPPTLAEFDRDRDGRITLLDLYLTIVRRVITDYHDNDLIPTEHALLDDNGDGRGTELQLDDLEQELGGRAFRRPLRDVIRPPGDGALAASILLESEEQNPKNNSANGPTSNTDQEKTKSTD